jgi:3-methyladenine DNA glycosylase AlkC
MKKGILLFGLLIVIQNVFSQNIENWANKHAVAHKALQELMAKDPQGAKLLTAWDQADPKNCSEFIKWASSNQDVKNFISTHKNSVHPNLNELIKNHPTSLKDFMGWCKTHNEAANNLTTHPSGGLNYVANNYFKDIIK